MKFGINFMLVGHPLLNRLPDFSLIAQIIKLIFLKILLGNKTVIPN